MDPHEGRRFWHGFGWGGAATLASGLFSVLMVVLHLAPLDHPLSVLVVQMVARDHLAWNISLPVAYLVAGAGQLGLQTIHFTAIENPGDPAHRAAVRPDWTAASHAELSQLLIRLSA